MNGEMQVIHLPADDEIQRIDAGIIEELVGLATRVLDKILAFSSRWNSPQVQPPPRLESEWERVHRYPMVMPCPGTDLTRQGRNRLFGCSGLSR